MDGKVLDKAVLGRGIPIQSPRRHWSARKPGLAGRIDIGPSTAGMAALCLHG
ncbi:MFS transporter [Blastomyces dermatitidis ER-3]|uniref:MFS transporter n=1 Tax=Ajellomyces dermatitidis (strain ER-3 / ATCC MYA-2586) TaxID=559297 RepID=A0ABX2VQ99_AJEDR|nr:MFS transporter [Blastomyces dermatitidis ER-3]OAS99428.1 MFS transporter [Blastomyces dermatitidis ER-3]